MSFGAEPIIFRTCAGLANRLRALVSAICLAEDLARPLKIIWDLDVHCGAPFHALFDAYKLPAYVSVSVGMGRPISKLVSTPDDVRDYFSRPPAIPILIHSYYAFYDAGSARWLGLLRSLKPEFFVEALFDTRMARIPEGPRVGVHIRRTDHEKSIQNSPTDAFVAAMKTCSEDTVFILATDSDKEVERLKAEFPGRIFTLAVVNERTTVTGIQNAVLDFLGLASSRKIFGSCGSSFSEMAALYGGVEMKVI